MILDDLDRSKYAFIEADNSNFQYEGRIDFTKPKRPTLIYAGSTIRTKFQGTSVKVVINNHNAYYENSIGYIIDGKLQGKVTIDRNDEDIILNISEGLTNEIHDLIIFKRMDGCHYFDFIGLIIDSGCSLLEPLQKPNRRIEVFGDSISAGEVVEAVEYVGEKDPENHNGVYTNAWYSYSLMTARKLNAQIHNCSQGGLAVLNGTGYFCGDNYLGLEFTYDKLRYNPYLGECNKWDFSNYIPHVVIMALGQNDANPDNYINTDGEKRGRWKRKYKELILTLKSKYPKALFILMTTILNHDEGWDDALDEIEGELQDPKIVRFKFKRNGCGTPGHVRIPEAEEMSCELTSFINSFGDKIWI